MKDLGKYQYQSHNPWWIKEELILEDIKIIEFNSQSYKWWHPFYFEFPKNEEAIFTLKGPRQVGKTTLLKLIIKKLLLEDKVKREAVFFYPCDRIKDFDELFFLLTEYINWIRPRANSKIYIFLDEISFISEWQRAIKELVDTGKLKDVILLLTGSNILDIKFSSERLPGRRGKIFKPDIDILPLDFSEFLKLTKPDIKEKSYQEVFSRHFNELEKRFEDYLLTGGFLTCINSLYTKEFIPSYLYEMYINWIEGDLHKAGKSEETALHIFERLFLHLSSTTSFYKIAKESGVSSHVTAADYIDILEKMFVLFKIDYFSVDQKKVDIKKNKKIYFYDPFILQVVLARAENFLNEAFSHFKDVFLKSELRPKLIEMLVGITLKKEYSLLYYGNCQGGEIDFVGRREGEYSFFEVKYQNQVLPSEFYKYKNIFKKLTVITKHTLDEDTPIRLIPAEIFLGFKDNFIKE